MRAVFIGLIAACVCLLSRLTINAGGWDLAWVLAAGRALRAGQNPYTAPLPLGLPLYYPLPAVLAVLPLTLLPDAAASVLFSFISATVLVYAVLTKQPRAWPMLLSAPFWFAGGWSQWSLLITAAALLPGLLPLALCKPTIGAPLLLLRWPARAVLFISGAVLLVSLLVLPSWPLEWLQSTRSHDSAIPLLTVPGGLLALAALRWREPRARLLLGLACVPQRFYDPLCLWLVPQTPRGGLVLSVLSWLLVLTWRVAVPLDQPAMELVVCLLYLPALALLWCER